jgi:hypothetical protein
LFSLIDAVLLRPLPYPVSERLAVLFEANAARKMSPSESPIGHARIARGIGSEAVKRMEPLTRIELVTSSLPRTRSTN